MVVLVASCTKPESTVAPAHTLPWVSSAFEIEGKPFRFLGAFGGGPWFLKGVPWQEELIVTAKEAGISVLHVMVPPFETELGVYDEKEGLPNLDLILDLASRNGIYVTIEVMQGAQVALDEMNPYYHPGCMEGLIKDNRLKDAYKKRLEYLIMHRNTVNGRIYRDDPTILAWLLIMEPRVPELHPQVTRSELRDWFQEMALYTKSLDPNHLVSVGFTEGTACPLQDDWLVAFDVPAIDFFYAEDAQARILEPIDEEMAKVLTDSKLAELEEEHKRLGPVRYPYPFKLFSLGKPVVIHFAFDSNKFDFERIGTDYVWQANTLLEMAKKYFEAGAAGVTLVWGSTLGKEAMKPYMSQYGAIDVYYDATNKPIVTAMKEIAAEFDTLDPIPEP